MINDVYRVVQIILNKNNYGVITPDKFNDLAKNAQLKIVYELPEDIRRAINRKIATGTKEAVKPLQNALDIFNRYRTIQKEASTSSPSGFSEHFVLPDDFYYLQSVWYRGTTEVDEINKKGGRYVLANRLTRPTTQFPVYERRGSFIYVFPESIGVDANGPTSDITIYYQRNPKDPKWTYITLQGKPVYNPSDSSHQDFELPSYFFNRLVVEIALFAGVSLREQEVQAVMSQEQSDNLQIKNFS